VSSFLTARRYKIDHSVSYVVKISSKQWI